MGAFELFFEDSSPLISYAPPGAWAETPINDTLISSYSAGTFHTTSAQGATATVSFNGTGISFYGAHRPGYGTYTITVDGKPIASNQSAAGDSPDFNRLMGTVVGLPDGPHTAVLANTDGANKPIDIDWVKVDTIIGAVGSSISNKTLDDSDSRISYGPQESDWKTASLSKYYGGGLHFTQTPGAQASLSFTGDAITIYGTVSQDHANINVTLDGVSKVFTGGAGGHVSALRPKNLLYYANGLDPKKPHQVLISPDAEDGTGPFVDIDAIVVYSATGGTETSSAPAPSQTNTGGDTSNTAMTSPQSINSMDSGNHAPKIGSLSRSTFIAVIVSSLLALLILSALLFFFIRRRLARVKDTDFEQASPATPQLPMQTASVMFGDPKQANPAVLFPEDDRSKTPSGASAYSFSSSTPIFKPSGVPILKNPLRKPKSRNTLTDPSSPSSFLKLK